jgi:hypothetical protein
MTPISDKSLFPLFENVLEDPATGRKVDAYEFHDCQVVGENLLYPNAMLLTRRDGLVYRVIDERTMSLAGVSAAPPREVPEPSGREDDPVFFFIYNTDNYFHFIYDTLPYLITYFRIRERVQGLRLLVSPPNAVAVAPYRFVTETLELLGIGVGEMVTATPGVVYSRVYVSSSFTHGVDSNLPPPPEASVIYGMLTRSVAGSCDTEPPRKIYVSRRSWVHGRTDNIGTNYTERRRLVVEDQLVDYLAGLGYREVFTETMTMREKICLFSQAESVVSAIGGGSCNVLFSTPGTEHLCIVSPTFLDVNGRFRFCLGGVRTRYYKETWHVDPGEFKRHMRVRCGQVVGEVSEVSGDRIQVSHTDHTVAGWNSAMQMELSWFDKSECAPLDRGLNSEWTLDMCGIISCLGGEKNIENK